MDNEHTILIVRRKNIYDVDGYLEEAGTFPICSVSKKLCKLMGTEALAHASLRGASYNKIPELKALGYGFKYQGPPERSQRSSG